MNKRLSELVRYKTGGRQKAFAELLGWSPSYLAKLLRGENFGLQPVLTLVDKLPEVNARWLLLGEGRMLNDDKILGLRRETYLRVQAMLAFDRFLPVMSADEIRRFEDVLAGKHPVHGFSDEDVARWETLLTEKDEALASRVDDAIAKSCRHPKASKS